MSKLLLGGVNTSMSVTEEIQGGKLSTRLHRKGGLNAAALRSLFEITHISYLFNGLLSIYGLNGSLLEAGGEAEGLILSQEAVPAS